MGFVQGFSMFSESFSLSFCVVLCGGMMGKKRVTERNVR